MTIDITTTPVFDLTRCWRRGCDEPAAKTRQVAGETIRLCFDDAETFDDTVVSTLARLQEIKHVHRCPICFPQKAAGQ